MEEAHSRAGDWLRGCKVMGQRIRLAERTQFRMLYRAGEKPARHRRQHGKAAARPHESRMGMILPVPKALAVSATLARSVSTRSLGGVLIPGSAP